MPEQVRRKFGDRARADKCQYAVDFGEQLFFEPKLSTSGKLSCGTCHVPERDWSDGLKRGEGMQTVDRNTPNLVNVRYHRWFGWDGGNDNLWAQSLRPLLDARELATSEGRVAAAMRSEPDFNCAYRRVFGDPARAPDDTVFVNVGKALAAYQETLVSARTPFDDFRDALARGDRQAMRRYPLDAQRGLKIFVGKGSCSVCHFGPAFTNGEFHEIGISPLCHWDIPKSAERQILPNFERPFLETSRIHVDGCEVLI